MSKEVTRKQLLHRLDQLSDRSVFKKSHAAGGLLCSLPEFQEADVIMTFFSLPKEVDTSGLIIEALAQNKTVLIPKLAWKQRRLAPVVIQTLNCPMEISRYGLRNPTSDETLPVSQIDLVVVPGLGFDERGNRIGRGAGFYDRFLADNAFAGIRCGLAFEEQVLDEVPVSEHDMDIDILITEARVRRFPRQPGSNDG